MFVVAGIALVFPQIRFSGRKCTATPDHQTHSVLAERYPRD